MQNGDDPTTTEKAQLHSDEVKLRKELAGDVPDKKGDRIAEVAEMHRAPRGQ